MVVVKTGRKAPLPCPKPDTMSAMRALLAGHFVTEYKKPC